MFESIELAGKDGKRQNMKINNIEVGRDFLLVAGPCSVESEEQLMDTAAAVKRYGANLLRGGAYKPRTSPYAFQGLGEQGLKLLYQAGKEYGLPIVSEVMDTRDVDVVQRYVDIVQIGTRNMQNYALLKEIGKAGKPVILKRGMCATIEEWLCSAEYIMHEGNNKVILCERGIRTIENYTRNTFDLSAVAAIKELSNLPIIADTSHATGRKELVEAVSLGAVMGGCDGLMIEVHINPQEAKSDAEQALSPEEFKTMAEKVKKTVDFRKKL